MERLINKRFSLMNSPLKHLLSVDAGAVKRVNSRPDPVFSGHASGSGLSPFFLRKALPPLPQAPLSTVRFFATYPVRRGPDRNRSVMDPGHGARCIVNPGTGQGPLIDARGPWLFWV